MWVHLRIELYKIFRKPRTYLAFAAITALIVIIQIGLYVDGKEYTEFVMADFANSFAVDGKILNGYFICYVLIHVPLLIALIAADMISGEANMGTLRLLLTKPQSRTAIVTAKFLASVIYTLMLLIWIAILGLFVSTMIFGTDDLFIMKSSYVVIVKESDVFWRYTGAFCFAALAMITVASLGFFLSFFAENSIGPIVATMSVIIVCTILSTMNIPIFNVIKPYLFTTHMITWKEFFDFKVNDANEAIVGSIQYPERIIHSSIVLLIHILGFAGGAILLFRKKDILS
jgi:ABC-2 type transport system permease protein